MTSHAVDPPSDLPGAVDRRYDEARTFARQGKHMLRTQADPKTYDLYKILVSRQAAQGRKQGQDQGRAQRHAQQYFDTDLVRALEIHESLHGLVRAKLQAYLLADLTCEEIGKQLDETARVVELYARCFFDVTQEMPAQTKNELVAAYKNVPAEQLVTNYFWKLVALTGGAAKLETIMADLGVRATQDAAAAAVAEAKLITQFKIAEAAKAIDVHDPNALRELRRIFENLDDVNANEAHDYLLDQIQQTLCALPFSKGPADPETTPPDLVDFSSTAVELNTDELQRLACGMELENKQELLAVKFPEEPAEHGAPSTPQPASAETAPADTVAKRPENAAEGETVDPAIEPMRSDLTANPKPKRATTAMQRTFVQQRVKKEQATAAARQADREQAAQQAADKTARCQQAAEQARWEELDRAWEVFAGDATGANLHRKRLQFRAKYPDYIPEHARKLGAPFEKRK